MITTTATITSKQSYIKSSQNKNNPINIISTDLIKCTHCNLYIPYNQIQSHNENHLPTNILKAIGHNKNINNGKIKENGNKIRLSSMLQQIQGKQNKQIISVKSILPQQMPKPQQIRKQPIKLPKGLSNSQSQQQLYKLSNKNGNNSQIPQNNSKQIKQSELTLKRLTSNSTNQSPDTLDLTSKLSQYYQQPQTNKQQNFKKQVQLKLHVTPVNYKQIKVYGNNNNIGKYIDNVKQLKKVQSYNNLHINNNNNENIDEIYTIMAAKQQKKLISPQIPIKIQIKTHRKSGSSYKQKISTVSTSGSGGFFKNSKLSNFFGTQPSYIKQDSDNNDSEYDLKIKGFNKIGNSQQNANNNLMCNGCKGFYCKQCGSDIPPIYRPVPNININNSNLNINLHSNYSYNNNIDNALTQRTNQQIKNYYQHHIYHKSDGKTSRVTKCTNCQ